MNKAFKRIVREYRLLWMERLIFIALGIMPQDGSEEVAAYLQWFYQITKYG